MTQTFAFAAAETPRVRGYSIGPHHIDWLCVKCGRVGAFEEIGPFAPSFETQCGAAAQDHVNVLDMEPDRIIALGLLTLRLRSERSLFVHLQHHVRFESIDRIEPKEKP